MNTNTDTRKTKTEAMPGTPEADKSAKNRAAAISILAAFAASLLLKLFCFDFIITEGGSMQPAINNGTILVVNKLFYGFRLPFSGRYLVRWRSPGNGEVLVFYTPKKIIAVKRCLLFEDGQPGSGQPGESRAGDNRNNRIEDKRWLALGDNAVNSYDSRSYGPLPFDSIIGKAMFLRN